MGVVEYLVSIEILGKRVTAPFSQLNTAIEAYFIG